LSFKKVLITIHVQFAEEMEFIMLTRSLNHTRGILGASVAMFSTNRDRVLSPLFAAYMRSPTTVSLKSFVDKKDRVLLSYGDEQWMLNKVKLLATNELSSLGDFEVLCKETSLKPPVAVLSEPHARKIDRLISVLLFHFPLIARAGFDTNNSLLATVARFPFSLQESTTQNLFQHIFPNQQNHLQLQGALAAAIQNYKGNVALIHQLVAMNLSSSVDDTRDTAIAEIAAKFYEGNLAWSDHRGQATELTNEVLLALAGGDQAIASDLLNQCSDVWPASPYVSKSS
jgi:hypothetical protein